MNGRRALLAFLGSIQLAAIFAGFGLSWKADSRAEPAPVAVPRPPTNRETRMRPVEAERRPDRAPAPRPRPESAPATPQAVSAELLAVLHACMAFSELRPAPGAVPDLSADPRALQDCLRGSDAMDVLQQLSASIVSLSSEDREDAALLVGYLAHHLLRGPVTWAERVAVMDSVLQAYGAIDGPALQSMTQTLMLYAYANDDPTDAVHELQGALKYALEVGSVPHVLGPLLSTLAHRTRRHVSGELPLAHDALYEMQLTVDQAIPKAIALGLAGVRSPAPPHRLRDSLLLLQNAFAAGSDDSASLRESVPRVLDTLAQLDVSQLRASGISADELNRLLLRTEKWVLKTGASDLNQAPPGGRTSPGELRRRWGIESRAL